MSTFADKWTWRIVLIVIAGGLFTLVFRQLFDGLNPGFQIGFYALASTLAIVLIRISNETIRSKSIAILVGVVIGTLQFVVVALNTMYQFLDARLIVPTVSLVCALTIVGILLLLKVRSG